MRKLYITIISILNLHNVNIWAQGAFTNLNFESANIPNGTQPGSIPISEGMPGWSANFFSPQYGYLAQTQVVYDGISGGGQGIAINDNNTGFGFSVIAGNYTAALFGGIGNVSSTISQTGTVPGFAKSMDFYASYSLLPFVVTMGGQTLDTVILGGGPNYTIYGADVSSFKGQTETLSFTEPGPTTGPSASSFYLDNISFSSQPTPEPDTWALLLCGAGLFGGFSAFRRK